MGNTYTSCHVHVVFSTKGRQRWISSGLENRLWAYLGGIAQNHHATPIQIGGVEDHVHLLLGLHPTVALSRLLQLMKGGSSHWVRAAFPEHAGFGWQDGYGAFSVSPRLVRVTSRYIRCQREHHQQATFQEEFVGLLERYRIPYQPQYLWD